jgi:hypothetical protein
MEQQNHPKFDMFIDNAEEYIKTKQELTKLVILQRSSIVTAGILSYLIIFFLFFFVIVFASFALAYVISKYTGEMYIGFISVATLYLISGLIVFAKRKSILEKPVINAMITNFLKDDDDE